MKQYVIQPREEGKGRSFSATAVALITAYGLFPEGNDGKTIRPVWGLFAGTEAELRSFTANLRTGRKAQPPGGKKGDGDRLEFLRSVGFLQTWQREAEGCLATIYHPELFRLDPGLIDPKGINFILLVPADWAESQAVDTAAAAGHVSAIAPHVEASLLQSLVPTAYLFAAYLDRRTRCPLVADGRFYLQLLIAALDSGMASLPGSNIRYASYYGREEWGRHAHHSFDIEFGEHLDLEAIGLQHAISVRVDHVAFEAFLAEQVTLYFQKARGRKLREPRVDLSRFVGANG